MFFILLLRSFSNARFLLMGIFAGALALTLMGPVFAGEVFGGPVEAVVERVVDGDTLSVRAHIWLGQDVRVMVRILGIDAPEMRGKCADERALAVIATDYLRKFEGTNVTLTQIANGKFAGRVLAVVHHSQEGDLGAALLSAGLARAYDGGRRSDWCGEVTAQAASPVDG